MSMTASPDRHLALPQDRHENRPSPSPAPNVPGPSAPPRSPPVLLSTPWSRSPSQTRHPTPNWPSPPTQTRYIGEVAQMPVLWGPSQSPARRHGEMSAPVVVLPHSKAPPRSPQLSQRSVFQLQTPRVLPMPTTWPPLSPPQHSRTVSCTSSTPFAYSPLPRPKSATRPSSQPPAQASPSLQAQTRSAGEVTEAPFPVPQPAGLQQQPKAKRISSAPSMATFLQQQHLHATSTVPTAPGEYEAPDAQQATDAQARASQSSRTPVEQVAESQVPLPAAPAPVQHTASCSPRQHRISTMANFLHQLYLPASAETDIRDQGIKQLISEMAHAQPPLPQPVPNQYVQSEATTPAVPLAQVLPQTTPAPGPPPRQTVASGLRTGQYLLQDPGPSSSPWMPRAVPSYAMPPHVPEARVLQTPGRHRPVPEARVLPASANQHHVLEARVLSVSARHHHVPEAHVLPASARPHYVFGSPPPQACSSARPRLSEGTDSTGVPKSRPATINLPAALSARVMPKSLPLFARSVPAAKGQAPGSQAHGSYVSSAPIPSPQPPPPPQHRGADGELAPHLAQIVHQRRTPSALSCTQQSSHASSTSIDHANKVGEDTNPLTAIPALVDKSQHYYEKRARYEESTRQKLVNNFLNSAGFASVHEARTTRGLRSATVEYPLHAAVRANEQGLVNLLLRAGADRDLQDSNNLTPLQLAQKLNRRNSHIQCIMALKSR